MAIIRSLAVLALIGTLGACASGPQIATRNAPLEIVPAQEASKRASAAADLPRRPAAVQPAMRIVDYEITVPQELRVSEANLYYPVADIVWRGDFHGNRKAQVAAIFEDGLNRAKSDLDGPRDVKAEIVVSRFHSLTEKARYTVGGVHSIRFLLTLRDAETDAPIVADRIVKADLKGFGGMRAMEAEKQGLTMKERITRHLQRVITAELTLPGGWQDRGSRLAEAADAI